MEVHDIRIPFGFAIDVICLRRKCNNIDYWVLKYLKLSLTPSLITFDVFVVFLP